MKGMRQGCPLSPTLFTMYIADLEEVMKSNQAGEIRVGREKIWTLAYADDIMLLAEDLKDLKDVIDRFGRYLGGKELQLNVDKSKVMIFQKGRRKEKKEEWSWKEQSLETVKKFKYLGYNFQKNGGRDAHIKEMT